jgi:hypothetical protein
VAVALDDLRRDRRRRQPEAAAHIGFDRRRQVREGADRARKLADADHLAGAPDAIDVAADLGVPKRQLQAKRHRLGVDAVRPADHRRAAMLERAVVDRFGEGREIGEHEIAGFPHLQRLRRIDHVRGGHAEMEPPGGGTDVLGDGRRKGDDVVLRHLLDGLDAVDVERAALANIAGGFSRNDASRRHGFGGGGFNAEPRLVAMLIAPDAAHLRVGVSRNH